MSEREPWSENDKRLSFIPIDQATRAPDGYCCCIRDSWWIVHPTRGLVIYKGFSPQCNHHEAIVRRMAPMYPWAEVRLIPEVFLAVDASEL